MLDKMSIASRDLVHYGILGMHWGVRRDGAQGSSRTKSSDHLTTANLKRLRLDEMSNSDLKALTTRMNLERNYRDLSSSSTAYARGRKFVYEVAGGVAKTLLAAYLTTVVTKQAGKLAKAVSEAMANR